MSFNILMRKFPVSPVRGPRTTKAQMWRFGLTLLAGKFIALVILFTVISLSSRLFDQEVYAQDASTPSFSTINPINTAWTLVAAFLVFGMQAGFAMLEAGFARYRETVNVLMECIIDTCLCGLLFWAVGYAFMFSRGNGFIGLHWFFLSGAKGTYEMTGIPILAHWVFQFAFADTCSTITSGAMIGRTGFRGDILYSIGVTGFIYPIIGHWAWGPDGFLAQIGEPGHLLPALGVSFHDFAGSTVVHTIGGAVSLAGAVALGPRLGRIFARDDPRNGGMPPPHNLVVAALGGFILWFGWYGFNPGSTLSAMDMDGIGRVAANTTLAACAAGLSAMLAAKRWGTGKFDLGYTINGFLGGLVAITCPCYWVSPFGAVCIGLAAGYVVFLGVNFLEWLRIDDPIGAVSVHGFCGIWGTLSLGLFATGEFGLTGAKGADNSTPLCGVFFGGGFNVFLAQVIGSLVITISTFLISLVMMRMIRKLPDPWNLRVSEAGETGSGGIDVYEHGIDAYPPDQ